MAAYAAARSFLGDGLSTPWQNMFRKWRLGDFVLVAFLLAQCFDGVFTYIGVATYGLAIEANPLMHALMTHLGDGLALAVSKSIAAGLGICLHVRQVHSVVALLALLYGVAAIVPWLAILFF
jgi:uncharacterized membrane protein